MLKHRSLVHTTSQTFFDGQKRTQAEWEVGTKELCDNGRVFLAYDYAKQGMNLFPASLPLRITAARALYHAGDLDEAVNLLKPLVFEYDPEDKIVKNLADMFDSLIKEALDGKTENGTRDGTAKLFYKFLPPLVSAIERHRNIEDLLTASKKKEETISGGVAAKLILDDKSIFRIPLVEDALCLLGRIYLEKWLRNFKESTYGLQALRAFQSSYNETEGYNSAVNCAFVASLLKREDIVREFAGKALVSSKKKTGFDVHGARGLSHLLLGEYAEAKSSFEKFRRSEENNFTELACYRRWLKVLKVQKLLSPKRIDAVLKILNPPTVVIFAGHMLDQAGRKPPRFPDGLEDRVRSRIKAELEKLDAAVGYCSACCGSDILFIEEMVARGGEVNIVLPFDKKDFIKTCVEYGGRTWLRRFENALRLANSVSYATEEKFFGENDLFVFLANIYHGYAYMRSINLDTIPYFLAVFKPGSRRHAGGTADLISRWPGAPGQLKIIDISRMKPAKVLKAGSNQAIGKAQKIKSPERRVIRAMLFSDVKNYSKLNDEQISVFTYEFMRRLGDVMNGKLRDTDMEYLNTWGDAIFAVGLKATDLVKYALALQDVVVKGDWRNENLPDDLNIRIALHAGPVFHLKDHVTNLRNLYGSHVNRAARIEPVTIPGCIYASEQFVAMLMAEQATNLKGDLKKAEYVCEGVGTIQLAKDFDFQMVYNIRKKTDDEVKYML